MPRSFWWGHGTHNYHIYSGIYLYTWDKYYSTIIAILALGNNFWTNNCMRSLCTCFRKLCVLFLPLNSRFPLPNFILLFFYTKEESGQARKGSVQKLEMSSFFWNFAPLIRLLFFKDFKHKYSIAFRCFPNLVLPVNASCQI